MYFFPDVEVECGTPIINCHNNMATFTLDYRGTFFRFSLWIQCLNKTVQCHYDMGGKLINDAVICPELEHVTNQSYTVVFHSTVTCSLNISAIDKGGGILNSTAVDIQNNCKSLYLSKMLAP